MPCTLLYDVISVTHITVWCHKWRARYWVMSHTPCLTSQAPCTLMYDVTRVMHITVWNHTFHVVMYNTVRHHTHYVYYCMTSHAPCMLLTDISSIMYITLWRHTRHAHYCMTSCASYGVHMTWHFVCILFRWIVQRLRNSQTKLATS